MLGITIYWTGDIACLWGHAALVGGHQLTNVGANFVRGGCAALSRRSPAGGAGVVEVALTLALVPWRAARAMAVLNLRLFIAIVPAMASSTVSELRQPFQRAEQPP